MPPRQEAHRDASRHSGVHQSQVSEVHTPIIDVASLHFGVLICKMGMTIVLTPMDGDEGYTG